MQLENMMEMHQPRVSEQKQQAYFVVGDLESLSASALYRGDKPIIRPYGMIVPLKINGIPLHDTYSINKEGNVSGGHSTVNLPSGGKVYLPHSIRAPSIKSGS